MAKKRKPEPVELLAPAPRTATDFKRLIAVAVERKVSEIMSDAGADFEPWFRPKKIASEIKRRQTVIEQRKWTYFFEDWGCIVCGAKDRRHTGNGFCTRCYGRSCERLKASKRKREKAKETDLHFEDSLQMAREALAQELPALPEKSTVKERKR